MQKRGGGRFGKYGDLKRKEKIRQARVLKRDDKAKASARRSLAVGRKQDRLPLPSTEGVAAEGLRSDLKPNGEADNS